MVQVDEVVAAASELTDAEILDVVRAVAVGRPGLAALVAAASPAPAPVVAAPPVVDPSGAVPAATVPPAIPAPDYVSADYTNAGVPTFEHMREKIEERSGTSIGESELAHESAPGRTLEEQWDAREKAGKARLEEIRRSLGK